MGDIATEKWLDEDGETWLVDPSEDILTDTDRARLAGCAPELLDSLEQVVQWAEDYALQVLGDDADGGNALIEGVKMIIDKARGRSS